MADFPNSTLLPENRVDLEVLIEAAIARLDELDGDADLEGGADDEPSLGCPERLSGSWHAGAGACDDDREADCEDEGAQCDDEGDRSDCDDTLNSEDDFATPYCFDGFGMTYSERRGIGSESMRLLDQARRIARKAVSA